MTLAADVQRRPAIDAFATGLMIALTFSWGLNQVAIKISNGGFNPVLATVLRAVIAALCVYAWCRLRGIPLSIRDGTLRPGILAGVLFGAEFVLLFFGLDYTTATRSVLMLNTMPFWTLVGAHLFLGDRITGMKLVGLLLAFGGVVVVFADQLSLPDSSALLGDLMCLGAGMLWAATIIVIKGSKLNDARPEQTLMYQLVVSALFALPLVPLAGPALREVTVLATGALLFQAIYVVAFTYLLWFWLMRRYPAPGLSSFAFLTPVWGVALGALLLGDELSWRIVAALVMIGLGLIVVNRPVRTSPPA